MKSIYVHVFYLSVIAFSGYNYWSSVQAFKAFEHLDRQLKLDYSILDYSTMNVQQKIDKNCKAYQTIENVRHYAHTLIGTKAVDSLNVFIEKQKIEFTKLNGGLDTTKNAALINGSATKISKNYFSEARINDIKHRLAQLNNTFIDSISNKWGKESLMKRLMLPQLLAENDYWNTFKSLPANAVLAKLSALQNKIKIDEIAFLNYKEDETTSVTICGWTVYRAAIAPKKASLIEGEVFEADVFIASYSNNLGSNVTIKVNGKQLEIKEGVAHFKGKKEAIGTKIIKAEALIKNPLTGQTTTTLGSFEYQVLPKCSRDCQ